METEHWIDTRFEDYFTIKNHHRAMCNICRNYYTIYINLEQVNQHLLEIHGNLFKVSLSVLNKNSVSQHYQILNNKLTCKYCETNNFSFTIYKNNIFQHLENKHKIYKDTAKKIRELLKEEFDCYEEKYFCKRCTSNNKGATTALPDEPLSLMKHLLEDHGIDFSKKQEIEETRFSILQPFSIKSAYNWKMDYFRKYEDTAICKICNKELNLTKLLGSLQEHIALHVENFSECEKFVTQITKTKTQCNICKSNIYVYYSTDEMILHLHNNHNFSQNNFEEFLYLMSEMFDLTIFETSKCKICKQIIQNISLVELIVHLTEKHSNEVTVLPIFISKELSEISISDFDNIAQDNKPSSSSQQSASSSSYNVNTSSSSKKRATELSKTTTSDSDNIAQDKPSSSSQQSASSSSYNVNTSSSSEIESTESKPVWRPWSNK